MERRRCLSVRWTQWGVVVRWGEGIAGKKGSYRYSIVENQSGAAYPMPEILARLRDDFEN